MTDVTEFDKTPIDVDGRAVNVELKTREMKTVTEILNKTPNQSIIFDTL